MYCNHYLQCPIFLFVSLCSHPTVLSSYLLSDLPSSLVENQANCGCFAGLLLLLDPHQTVMKEAGTRLGRWRQTGHRVLMKQNFMLLGTRWEHKGRSALLCQDQQALQCEGHQELHICHLCRISPNSAAKQKLRTNVLFSAAAGHSYGK